MISDLLTFYISCDSIVKHTINGQLTQDSMYSMPKSNSAHYTQRGRSRAGSFNTDLANLGARVVPGSCMTPQR